MKYIFKTLIIILFFTISGNVLAGQKGEIRLTDGSLFYGEIVSVKNGVYIIETESMGTVKINKSKVQKISFGSLDNRSFPSTETNKANSEINDIKTTTASITKTIKNDKEIMLSIMKLSNHPDLLSVLNDPTIKEAINSGDISHLLSNPKIQKLMNNQTIKDITSQLSK